MSNSKTESNNKIIRIPRLCGNCIFRPQALVYSDEDVAWFCPKIQQLVHQEMLACRKFHEYNPSTANRVHRCIDWKAILHVTNRADVKNLTGKERDQMIKATVRAHTERYEVRLNKHKPKPFRKTRKNKAKGRFSNLDL